ncbi:purine nucleoside permease [Irpex rosettiformis]|uniref:Purine nucleoside permease n=1 Tax=Irpex rosettiformis TaxID=378272 RepID=A0ACB8U1D1_9APHY|nr:purine nucleoside permease [Irpex rosettiformis]
MESVLAFLTLWAAVLLAVPVHAIATLSEEHAPHNPRGGPLAPKVFIISMFDEEGDVWFGLPQLNVLANNITVPGFSPLFPQAHCTVDGAVCQVTTGEGEINAAVTISSLTSSSLFNLRNTYFLIAGVAGISPTIGTIGSVTFARFAVQVGLQQEIDAREIPSNFSTGYFPQGAEAPTQFPTSIYGTEVFELNDNLRQLAISFAKTATLFDDDASKSYRAHYASNSAFAIGAAGPSIVACDTATSDQFWSGELLASAFENATRLFTNGQGTYCTTQQEDNATLEALLRAAIAGRVDFSRIITMRSGSDFDRPFAGQTVLQNLLVGFPGIAPSLANLRLAGLPVVQGIVNGWSHTFARGVKPNNYIGDIFGSLGGQPTFGPGSIFGGKTAPVRRRSGRRASRTLVSSGSA